LRIKSWLRGMMFGAEKHAWGVVVEEEEEGEEDQEAV
jgi:hypothetical protein